MNKNKKRSKMFSIVEQWQQSGMSQKAFSHANGINIYTLRYWISQSRQRQNESLGFVQLNEPAVADICLRYPNGVELLLPVHTPISVIKGLINL